VEFQQIYYFSNQTLTYLQNSAFSYRYARQVAEFFEFVKKKKESPPEQTGNDKGCVNPQIMLPNGAHLWVPKGPFPGGSPMNMDFRRAMSSYLST
jgi:hypothetical protein